MNHYFVYDCYTASGRPKGEDAVMQYARDKYMYCLLADYMLEDVQMDLERYCMKIREENRRLPASTSMSPRSAMSSRATAPSTSGRIPSVSGRSRRR